MAKSKKVGSLESVVASSKSVEAGRIAHEAILRLYCRGKEGTVKSLEDIVVTDRVWLDLLNNNPQLDYGVNESILTPEQKLQGIFEYKDLQYLINRLEGSLFYLEAEKACSMIDAIIVAVSAFERESRFSVFEALLLKNARMRLYYKDLKDIHISGAVIMKLKKENNKNPDLVSGN